MGTRDLFRVECRLRQVLVDVLPDSHLESVVQGGALAGVVDGRGGEGSQQLDGGLSDHVTRRARHKLRPVLTEVSDMAANEVVDRASLKTSRCLPAEIHR